MEKSVVKEIIKWSIENAFNIQTKDGTHYISIDYEEMRENFDEWLEIETIILNKKQNEKNVCSVDSSDFRNRTFSVYTVDSPDLRNRTFRDKIKERFICKKKGHTVSRVHPKYPSQYCSVCRKHRSEF